MLSIGKDKDKDKNLPNTESDISILSELFLVPSVLHPHSTSSTTLADSKATTLREVDRRLAAQREAELRKGMSKRSQELFDEVKQANELMGHADELLRCLSTRIEALQGNNNNFKSGYADIRHKVGLIKCDISDELRTKLLLSLHSTASSVHDKSLEKFTKELMEGGGELSVDELLVVVSGLTKTLKRIK